MKQIAILFIACLLMTTLACKAQKEGTTADSTNTERASQPRQGDRSSNQRSGRKGGPPSIDEIFKLDSNQDGKLAKSEVKGPLLKDFDKIDTNEDGFLSREEVEKAPKPQRGNRPSRQ